MGGAFLKNAWYCAGLSRELSHEPLGRVFLGEPVVMYRCEDGTPVALEDTCPHRRAPLHKGELKGDNIQCPYHGIVFDPKGAAVWAQGKDAMPPKMCLRVYPLVERHTWLWIWMGDPARADESLIFDCATCDDPAWAVISGTMHVKAAAMLAIDNLMDLSHTAFVHRASVGSEDDLSPELVWERGPNWIKGTRVALGLQPAPHQIIYGAKGMVDQTKIMKYTPPYNCNVDIFSTDAGCKLGEGEFNEQFLTYNLITPETERSFHYFWANTRNFQVNNPDFQAIHQKNGEQLLGEDKWILEETQHAIDLNPQRPEIDLTADAGGIQARRLLRRLLDAEAAENVQEAVA